MQINKNILYAILLALPICKSFFYANIIIIRIIVKYCMFKANYVIPNEATLLMRYILV